MRISENVPVTYLPVRIFGLQHDGEDTSLSGNLAL